MPPVNLVYLESNEGLAFEEPFPDEGDVALDDGLVLRVVGTCRIGQEPAERRVLEEGAVEARRVWIGELEAGLQAVDDNALLAPAEEAKGLLEAVDHGLEVLTEDGTTQDSRLYPSTITKP